MDQMDKTTTDEIENSQTTSQSKTGISSSSPDRRLTDDDSDFDRERDEDHESDLSPVGSGSR